ncbi:hypothetical protein BROUX41_002738 [Berkeleyomyces rouxiae]|uniref:uncharacterized protein n=1 Tax=Berkeleyomyces rouxiae TaxID=2035830 RepID=UPI003B7D50AF
MAPAPTHCSDCGWSGLSVGAQVAIYVASAFSALFCVSFIYYYSKECHNEQSEYRPFSWKRVLVSTLKFSTLIGIFTWTYHQYEFNKVHREISARTAKSRKQQQQQQQDSGRPKAAFHSHSYMVEPAQPPRALLTHISCGSKARIVDIKQDKQRGRGLGRDRARPKSKPLCTPSRSRLCEPVMPGERRHSYGSSTGGETIEPVFGGCAESYYVESQMAMANTLDEITKQPYQPVNSTEFVFPCDGKQVVYARESNGE